MNSLIEWVKEEIKDVRRATSKLYAKKKDADVDDEIPFLEGQDFAYNSVLQKLKTIKMGHLRADNSGHWYLIPVEKSKLFYPMLDKACSGFANYEDEFIDAFDEYRLSGGVEDLEIPVLDDTVLPF